MRPTRGEHLIDELQATGIPRVLGGGDPFDHYADRRSHPSGLSLRRRLSELARGGRLVRRRHGMPDRSSTQGVAGRS
ncbi:MAG: hypothetical protein HQ582_11040 [Planctomycetes bacterium]|nr:hypothetical protein [Planctomycetota bacterium]